MKKTLFLFTIIGFLFACQSSSTPASVAEGFVEAIAKGKFDAAKKYVSSELEPMIGMMAQAAKVGGEEMSDKLFPDYNFELKDEKIDGETAKVTYINPEGEEETIDLKKQDGKWVVHMEK